MPHLPEAIASITCQTFPDFEVLAVDDGSRDATGEVLAEWANDDHRVRVLEAPTRGLVPALEHAREHARGRFLARMDADDRSLPRRFARQHDLLMKHPDIGICGTHVRYFPEHAVRDGARRYETWLNGLEEPEDIARDVFVECPLAHPTFFMRAGVVSALGGYVDRGWPEDYDLVLRAWEAGVELAVIPEVLFEWRESPSRLSRRSPTYSIDAFRRCKVHYLLRTRLRDVREVVIWGAGPTGKSFGRMLQACGMRVAAWVDVDPRKVGQEIHGAPVLAPEQVAPAAGRFVLAAVARADARREVRSALSAAGFHEPADVLAIA